MPTGARSTFTSPKTPGPLQVEHAHRVFQRVGICYANAGDNPPILVRSGGTAEMLEGGGPVLGILSTAPYSEMHAKLNPGDMLVLYSDGVTEANNPAFDEFGEERFIHVLKQHLGQPATAIVDAAIKALTEFCAGAPQAEQHYFGSG